MKNEPNENDLQNSTKFYSEEGFFEKIKKYAKSLGKDVVEKCVLLYIALTSSKTPLKYKSIIVGALGYFISPIDLIPDAIPIAGFADDIAAITSVITLLCKEGFIHEEDRAKAKQTTKNWFDSDTQS